MDATATRQRILEAAERHYAERGFDGMSMRALTSEAEVNLAAVNYHFGSKKELIHAIFRERIVPMNAERLALLKKAQEKAGDAPIPLEVIIDAFLQPVAQRASGPDGPDIDFLRMVGRCLSEDADFWHRLYVEEFQETVSAFRGAIHRTVPGLSEKELKLRFHFCVSAMLGALVKHQQFMREMKAKPDSNDISTVFLHLRDFLCAGFRAEPAS